MKRLLLAIFLLLFLVSSASATLLTYSFATTGEILTNSLETYGLSYGDTVSYNGSFLIDTSLITLDDINFYGNIANKIAGSGDFVVSGQMAVNDLILPIAVDHYASINLQRMNPDFASYESYLAFGVLSPLTGDMYQQNLYAIDDRFNFDMDYYLANQDDPFLGPLESSQGWVLPSLGGNEGILVGGGPVMPDVQDPVPPNSPVPEPSTILLIGIGLIGFSVTRNRGCV